MRGCVGAYGTESIGASLAGCDGIHPRGGTNETARHGELGASQSHKQSADACNFRPILEERLLVIPVLAVKAALALAGLPDLLD